MSLVPTPAPATALASVTASVESLAAAFLLGYEGATRAAYGRDLRSWFDWCAAHDLDPLNAQRAHLDAYARTLAEVECRSPATVARHVSTLSGFYRYAVAEDVVARNPVANVKRPKVGSDTVSTGLSRDELGCPHHSRRVRLRSVTRPCAPSRAERAAGLRSPGSRRRGPDDRARAPGPESEAQGWEDGDSATGSPHGGGGGGLRRRPDHGASVHNRVRRPLASVRGMADT